MREVVIYLLVGVSALTMMSYAVHMFVGGLVTAEVECFLIAATCSIVSGIMGYMVADVIHHRSAKK